MTDSVVQAALPGMVCNMGQAVHSPVWHREPNEYVPQGLLRMHKGEGNRRGTYAGWQPRQARR